MTLKKKTFFLLFTILALVLSACATATPAPQTNTPAPTTGVTSGPTAAAGENPLVGTQWALESMGSPGAEIPVLSGSNVTLSFESDTQVGGSAGCNSFGGNYKVDGNKITFDQLIHTMMACADESVMQQENAYMNALQMAGTYELSGDRLVISYNDGQGALNFVKTSG